MLTNLAGNLRRHARIIWGVILVLGIVGQTAFLLRDFILPWGWRAKQVLDEPRLVRSADMSMGVQATRAIQFIRQVVPEDAAILLPPEGEPARFSLQRSMQYFFFPRRVIECGSLESGICIQALSSTETYVLATQNFPPQDATIQKAFAPAPDTGLNWFAGVYGPAFDSATNTIPARGPSMLTVALKDVGLILAVSLLGIVIISGILGEVKFLDALYLSFPTGAGIFAWSMFILSWLGVDLSIFPIAVAYGFLIVIPLVISRRRGRLLRVSLPAMRWNASARSSAMRLVIVGLAVGIVGVAIALSVGTSYRLFDPVQFWSVKGYGISYEGSIYAAERWGVHGLAYPLNIPLQISLFHIFDGDALPGSKILYPIYGLAICLSVYCFLRRQRVDSLLAGLGALLLGTVPIFFFHSVSGFANLPFTFYLIAGILWSLEGIQSSSPRAQFVGGLMLGLATWTRPEGILYVLGVLIVFVIGGALTRVGRISFGPLVAPIAVLAGSWFIFSLSGDYVGGSNLDQAVSVFMREILSGNADFRGLWTIIGTFSYAMFIPYQAMFPAISATAWGVFFPVVLPLIVWGAHKFGRRHNPKGFILAVQLLYVASLNIAIFFVRSYSKPAYTSFIERAFPRAFLPTAVLLVILALWALEMRTRADPGSGATDSSPGARGLMTTIER